MADVKTPLSDNIALYSPSTSPEEKFTILEAETRQRLLNLLGGTWEVVPDALEYIVREVTAIKFNRLGNEGLSTLQTEGMTASLREDYFKPYMDEISAYADDGGSGRSGRILYIG